VSQFSRGLREDETPPLMTADELPAMEPLAPIVDQMREIAEEAIPFPQTCEVNLWDDDTVGVKIYHSVGDEMYLLRYQRQTSEIVLEYAKGPRWQRESLTGGEIVHEPTLEERKVGVITTVEPPYE